MKSGSEGVISLLKGKLRTSVQKTERPSNVNKFFIKTRTAALGVRGTEFQTIYNPDNKITSLLTYKGEVAVAKIEEYSLKNSDTSNVKIVNRDEITNKVSINNGPEEKLDDVQILNKLLKSKAVVLVSSGQNSFVSENLKKTSLPVKISPLQLEALYNNPDFQEKTPANLNLQSAVNTVNLKSTLVTAKQSSPAQGFFNEKTGDFAPKSGGFIDLNTGLYIPPDKDALLDPKSGVYVANKIGDIDADTGQYVAPKGLILDAQKGFILADNDGDSQVGNKPELFALREDLNKTIAKDLINNGASNSLVEKINLNEKFIRDRFIFSFWDLSQNIRSNEGQSNSPYLEIDSSKSMRLSLDWAMATTTRFSPLIGLDYSFLDFSKHNVVESSKYLMSISFGSQYALKDNINLFTKIGLIQEHFLNQSSVGAINSYELKKVALTRISAGANIDIWQRQKFSFETIFGGLFTFRKNINDIVINEGAGFFIEALPKYKLSDKKYLGVGLKMEKQYQRVDNSNFTNRITRKTGGIELKFISDI